MRSTGTVITPADLPLEIRGAPRRPQPDATSHAPARDDTAGGVGPADAGPSERERILRALNEAGWNRADAARRLGLSRVTLWRKIREHGIVPRG